MVKLSCLSAVVAFYMLLYVISSQKIVSNQSQTSGITRNQRFLLYDVNYGEGFNLRRDVYIRVANLIFFLNKERDYSWTLVLPPWGRIYHWKSGFEQTRIPWRSFFDIESLKMHIPVIEYEDYISLTGGNIEEVYYLQRYDEGWVNGEWTEKLDKRTCLEDPRYIYRDGFYRGWFWGYGEETKAKRFACLSVQAHAVFMTSFLARNTTARSIMFDRAEQLIHGQYSEWSREWWTARRSLVFAEHLRFHGDEFRRKHLNSTDFSDRTQLDENWTHVEKKHGDARGGPYVAAHLRRRDFLYAHEKDVPSIESTTEQLRKILRRLKLQRLFIATDAPDEEFMLLKSSLTDYTVVRYKPDDKLHRQLMDGGVAIVDQWICAHARYFIGTSVSTFTFRIHEEREILGFKPSMTYNRLCADAKTQCEQPTKWEIIY